MIPSWLLWTLATVLAWGIWAILFKLIEKDLSAAQSHALSTIGLLPIIVALYLLGDRSATGNVRLGICVALGSGLISSLGNICYYKLLNHAKAATVIPLTALYPLVTVVLALLLLDERLSRIQVLGIAASLCAIYLFNVQDEKGFDFYRVFQAMMPIGLWGLTGFLQKLSTNDISATSSAICFFAAFIPIGGWIMLRNPLPRGVSARVWILAVALGFTLGLGNMTILRAFDSEGKASIIAPLAGLYPLISVPIAILALGERITWRECLGFVFALVAVTTLSIESASEVTNLSVLEWKFNQ
jgi:drug/metabolite transporter (DMT)-like permease